MHTIAPQTNLPSITDSVSINGFSQPGSSINTLSKGPNARPKIQIDGIGVESITPSDGLRLSAPFIWVTGLVINHFTTGVEIFTERASLTQKFIGTDPTGTLDRGDSGSGVLVQGFAAFVGGSLPQDANLISANTSCAMRRLNFSCRAKGS